MFHNLIQRERATTEFFDDIVEPRFLPLLQWAAPSMSMCMYPWFALKTSTDAGPGIKSGDTEMQDLTDLLSFQ